MVVPGAKNLSPSRNNRIIKERHAASHKVIKILAPDSILNSILASKVRMVIDPPPVEKEPPKV